MEIGYINGRFVELDEPVIPIDERGHQFGDGVYEVIRVYGGKPFMMAEHLERLMASAAAIKLNFQETREDFQNLILKAVEKSQMEDCNVYLQITRGITVRNHLFPECPVSITMTVRKAKLLPDETRNSGVSVLTLDDERWANCYIKSLNLLPNILAKQTAFEAGCYEAILIRDGFVTEGTSSNVFIVKNGEIYTTPLSRHILAGITRLAVKQISGDLGISFIEERFSSHELFEAEEIFITSTTSEILPVVSVDGRAVGNGKPGPVTERLYQQFKAAISS